MQTENENGQSLKDKLTAYLRSNPDCTAVIVQPSSEIADIIAGSEAIRGYLQGLVAGRPMTPRSWFGETEKPEELLKQVLSIIESTKINSPFANKIKDFTLLAKDKFGPQGGTPPIAETVDIILRGFKPNKVNYSDPLWIEAKRLAVKELQFHSTGKPWSYQRVINDKKFK